MNSKFSWVWCLLLPVTLGWFCPGTSWATVYYVDDINGSDVADGKANAPAGATGPWQTLLKVNATTFSPGDQLLLKAGGKWVGQLHPSGSGKNGKPIVLDSYGEGSRPLIAANGSVNSAVRFFNQSYWEIHHLELTNAAGKAGDLRGISIEGCDAGVLSHLYIQDCAVHDVSGEARYFGSGTGPYEVGKRTGGIVFWTDSQKGVKTRFDDVLIRGNTLTNNSFGAIVFKQTNKYKWALREGGMRDPRWYPHTNIRIEENTIDQSGSLGNLVGVLLTAVQNATVSGNTLKEPHQCGIELDYAENCLIERNQVYRTSKGSSGTDACALDFDRCCDHTTWQYNYLCENGVGILSCHGINPWDFGSENKVRYNVFENCRAKDIFLVSKGGPDYIYNNVFYNDKFADVAVVDQPTRSDAAEVTIANNIFYQMAPGGRFSEGHHIHYDANCYRGDLRPVLGDAHQVTSDPRFVDPHEEGAAENAPEFRVLAGYKLREDSPCIHAGVAIGAEQMRDLWGTQVSSESPSIGVYEPR